MSISPPYLRASGSFALTFPVMASVEERYQVVAPQIWRDTQPETPPLCQVPTPLAQRYGLLYPRQLHLPQVYDVLSLPDGEILLLDNIPINDDGELFPSLASVWETASPLQQLNWLWQIVELWADLAAVEMASSLVLLENLRVDGWRVRLMELLEDSPETVVTFSALANSWRSLQPISSPEMSEPLAEIIECLSVPDAEPEGILSYLNRLLLAQSSQQHLQIAIASATDPGERPTVNQDAHYPTAQDLAQPPTATLALSDHLLVVCDGVEGHAQGEIAAQLAIQSLKLQVSGFFQGLFDTQETLAPDVIKRQLAAYIRITNNMIAERNDQAGHTGSDRMATTLTLALQIPQKTDPIGLQDHCSHELYLAQVGDSRAYWITQNQCICLTVDDDVLGREVQAGRALYRQGLCRLDHMALTQALGVKSSDKLHPVIQRFVLAEDGVLVVCSDGLSDHQFLENHWQTFAPIIIQGQLPPGAMLQALMQQAIAKNRDDNITAVIAFYRFVVDRFNGTLEVEDAPAPSEFSPEFLPPDLAEDEVDTPTAVPPKEEKSNLSQFALIIVSLVAVLILLVLAAFGLNWLLNRNDSPLPPTEPTLEAPTPEE